MLLNKLFPLSLVFLFIPLLVSANIQVEKAYFNHEKTVGVEFQANQDSNTLSIDYIGYMSAPPSATGKRAVEVLKEAISILVDGTYYPGFALPLSVPSDSTHEIRIEIGKPPLVKKLSEVRYRPDFGFSANTPQISKFSVSFFRELGQVLNPNETIQRWLSRSQNQIDLDTLKPAMDLHTHFTGALRTDAILEIAERNKIPYPKQLLEELGIDLSLLESADGANVYLSRSKIAPTDWLTLRNSMTLHTFQVATFPDMERKYRFRSPITKHTPSFKDFLWSLARDYQEFGVKYAELSISDIVKPDFLKIAQHELPEIEKTTKVKLRFLVGMWRHMPNPFDNFNLLTRIKDLNCPEIVGIDIMGHETNATKDIEPLIKKAAEYKRTQRSHFVIRVHAGENDVHPKNVEEAIEAGATRIGHGINGITEKVLQEAIDHNVIIEINLNSNMALSNIQNLDQVIQTLRTYILKGVKLTLGTDGHGLYETSNASEFESVRYLGLTADEFMRLKATENEYLHFMQEGFDWDVMLSSERSSHSPSQAISTAGHWKSYNEAALSKQSLLKGTLTSHGISVIKDLAELETYEPQKTPVMIISGGASRWMNMGPKKQSVYTQWITDLQRILDPSKTFFISSGTELGVDAAVYAGVKTGLISPPLGLIPASTFPAFIAEQSGAAMVIGENWVQRNDSVISFLNRRKGILVFLDTGESTKELLVGAINLRRESTAGAGLRFFVYKPSESTIRNFLDRIEPSHLFSSVPEIELGLQQIGAARTSSLPVETTSQISGNSEKWSTFKPKHRALPSYCRSEEIRTFASANYDHELSDGPTTSPTKMRADEEEIVEFIRLNADKNRIFPDPFRSVSNQVVFFSEFRDYALLFHQPEFSIDPRFLYYFFTHMNSSEILDFLRLKLSKGRKAAQELAKLCIYLDLYAIENLSDLPIPTEWPLLMRARAMADRSGNEELDAISVKKQAKLDQFKANGFISYHDVFPDVVSPRLTAFTSSKALTRSKRLIIVRGVADYNQAAISINKVLTKNGDSSVIFGTDSHRAESWVDHYVATHEELGHLELKEQSRTKNQKVFEKLLEIQYPIIIFATQGTNPQESFSNYVHSATRAGYQIVIVTASLVPTTKDYAVKTEQRAFEVVESWQAKDLNFDELVVPQQPFEEYMRTLK